MEHANRHHLPMDAAQAEQRVRKLNVEGLRLLQSQPHSAFDCFANALQIATDPVGALVTAGDVPAQLRATAACENNLGLFYYHMRQYEAAESHLSRAAHLEGELGTDAPTPGATLLNLAQVLQQTPEGQSRCLATVQRAVQLQRDRAECGSLLPYEREKELRLLARALAFCGDLVRSEKRFTAAAAAYHEASEVYQCDSLRTRADLEKADELRLQAKGCITAAAQQPRLDEAHWRSNTVYRSSDRNRPAADEEHYNRTGLAHLTRLRPVDVDVAAELPPATYRFDAPRSHATKQVEARRSSPTGGDSKARSTTTVPSRPHSARTSRRSSYASDQIASQVYAALGPKHKEAYDALHQLELKKRTTTDADPAAQPAPPPPPPKHPFAAVSYDPPQAASRPTDFAILMKPYHPPAFLTGRPRSSSTRRPQPPSSGLGGAGAPAPAAVGSSTTVVAKPPTGVSRSVNGGFGGAAARQARLRRPSSSDVVEPDVQKATQTPHVPAAPSHPAAVDNEATIESASESPTGVDGSPDMGATADPSESGSDDGASAAVVVQRSWRSYRAKKSKAEAARQRAAAERQRAEELAALTEQIRATERAAAAVQARRDLEERERALELKRREMLSVAAQKAQRREQRAERKDQFLAQLMSLGSDLDKLQATVMQGAVASRDYLHAAQEQRRQRRIVFATLLQGCMRQRTSHAHVRAKHTAAYFHCLGEWAQRRLECRAAVTLQGFFRRTIGVMRAEAIAEAKRAAAAERALRVAIAVQRCLRTRASCFTVFQRFSKMVVRGISLLQSAFRSKQLRVVFLLQLSIHRVELHLRAVAEDFLKAHETFGAALLRDEAAWWEGLVSSHMSAKPTYAANKIKAVWKRHRYGRALEAQWRANIQRAQAAERARFIAETRAKAALGAVLVLQRVYRKRIAARQRKYRTGLRLQAKIAYLERASRLHAAKTLQGFFLMIRAKNEKVRRRETARQLALVRRWRLEKQDEENKKLQAAATETILVKRIQSFGRSYLARKQLRRYRIDAVWRWERLMAQRCLSRIGRGFQERRALGIARRSAVASKRAVRTQAAVAIQQQVRTFLAARLRERRQLAVKAHVLSLVLDAASIRIQATARAFLASLQLSSRQKQLAQLLDRQCATEAVGPILSAVLAGYAARRQLGIQRRRQAASIIASLSGVYRARHERQRLEEERCAARQAVVADEAAAIIQHALRAHSLSPSRQTSSRSVASEE